MPEGASANFSDESRFRECPVAAFVFASPLASVAVTAEPREPPGAMRASSAPPARAWRAALYPPLTVAFAVTWVAVQAVLVLTASRRADAAFGFQMFAESSTLTAQLWRDVDAPSGHGTTRVPVREGEWVARGADGRPHAIRWRDRVIEPNLATFGVTMHASYSAAAQVERWHAALDDVAAHLASSPSLGPLAPSTSSHLAAASFADDVETRGLHLELVVRRNGREPVTYEFDAQPFVAPAATPR